MRALRDDIHARHAPRAQRAPERQPGESITAHRLARLRLDRFPSESHRASRFWWIRRYDAGQNLATWKLRLIGFEGRIRTADAHADLALMERHGAGVRSDMAEMLWQMRKNLREG